MKHNQEKATALLHLYSMVIDYVVSGYLYIDYQRYGIPYVPNSRYNLYIHTYIERGYIRIQAKKKYNWIGKYG